MKSQKSKAKKAAKARARRKDFEKKRNKGEALPVSKKYRIGKEERKIIKQANFNAILKTAQD